jgi:hypothetical protein
MEAIITMAIARKMMVFLFTSVLVTDRKYKYILISLSTRNTGFTMRWIYGINNTSHRHRNICAFDIRFLVSSEIGGRDFTASDIFLRVTSEAGLA